MIRMSKLINLEALREKKLVQTEQVNVEVADSTDKRTRLEQVIAKLATHEGVSDTQLQKLEELKGKLTLVPKPFVSPDMDRDGDSDAGDAAAAQRRKMSRPGVKGAAIAPAVEEAYDEDDDDDDYDARRDRWAMNATPSDSEEKYRSPYARTTPPPKQDKPKNEAITRIVEGDTPPTEDPTSGDPENPVDDHEGQMAKSDLLAIHKKAGELYNMVGENEELEGWVQEKISLASDYINSVHSHMEYEKNKPGSVGTGMGAPADKEMTSIHESAPTGKGWEKLVKKLKKHEEIDNPWALAHWMKGKGYKPKADEQVDEAYKDPYAAKKAAERDASHAELMKQAADEYKASKQSKGKIDSKSFMKPKVNELSLKTTKSYLEKAKKSQQKLGPSIRAAEYGNDDAETSRLYKIATRRQKGIARAEKKVKDSEK